MIYKILYYLTFTFRVIIPPFIFLNPLLIIFISTFLDIIDVEFASKNVLSLKEYELKDKFLDWWWYFFAMIYSWINLTDYKYFLLILFVFRTVGDFVFFIKKNRKILFFFPNFFEFFFFLIFFTSEFNFLNFLLNKNYIFFSFLAIIILKIFQEWWIHIALISIPEMFFGKKRCWKKT